MLFIGYIIAAYLIIDMLLITFPLYKDRVDWIRGKLGIATSRALILITLLNITSFFVTIGVFFGIIILILIGRIIKY